MPGTGSRAEPDEITLHASAVAVGDRAVLIEGRSGSGKSGLALTLMAYGAQLIADDRVTVTRRDGALRAAAPVAIAGRIEARGVGILGADPVSDVPLHLAVALDVEETDRLPPQRSKNLLGIHLPVVHYVASAYFAPAILQYLKGGRHD